MACSTFRQSAAAVHRSCLAHPISTSQTERSASHDAHASIARAQEERDAFEQYDNEHKIRAKMVSVLEKEFADLKLKFSIGGQISFDVFPQGYVRQALTQTATFRAALTPRGGVQVGQDVRSALRGGQGLQGNPLLRGQDHARWERLRDL